MEINFSVEINNFNMPIIIMNYLNNGESFSKEINLFTALDIFPLIPIEIIIGYKDILVNNLINNIDSLNNGSSLLQYSSNINEINKFLNSQEGS